MTGVDKRTLRVLLGREAARRIAAEGWSADLFDLLLGASGGAKWLVLGHLDRLLFGQFLAARQRPLSVLGSSIGSWRLACLATADPCAAIDRFERAYLEQTYSYKPGAQEISEVSRGILDRLLDDGGAEHLLRHPRIQTHIVTTRGRGLAAASSRPALTAGMGLAALGNSLSRSLLHLQFQRVVFHSAAEPRPQLHLSDFRTAYSPLDAGNVHAALMATGSIPFVLTGERDIAGGPRGHYWDGGILDYHFDLSQYHGDGLILYPHFGERIFPGWFDKFLPWRSRSPHEFDRLVMLCPTTDFIADLPRGKIPDRSDFFELTFEERVDYWERVVERSRVLAEEFAALLAQDDPLAGTEVLD